LEKDWIFFSQNLRLCLTLWEYYLKLQTRDGTLPGNAGLRTGFSRNASYMTGMGNSHAGTETGVPGICRAFGE